MANMPRRTALLSLALGGLALAGPSTANQPLPFATDAERVAHLSEQLFRDANAPVLGNPEGSVTLVEFFDYNCHFCRRNLTSVENLVAEDDRIRVVLREWPIMGADSVEVARLSLASMDQGRYADFHHALMMQRGKINRANALRIAREIGLDTDRLERDPDQPRIVRHMEQSLDLGKALDLRGTPSWVIGDRVIFGFMSKGDLQEALTESN